AIGQRPHVIDAVCQDLGLTLLRYADLLTGKVWCGGTRGRCRCAEFREPNPLITLALARHQFADFLDRTIRVRRVHWARGAEEIGRAVRVHGHRIKELTRAM